MSEAIEVIKEFQVNPKNYVSYAGGLYEAPKFNRRLVKALGEALLALEQNQKLKEWLEKEIKDSERYPDTWEGAFYYRTVLEKVLGGKP
jgi:CYTH domain-containing protein